MREPDSFDRMMGWMNRHAKLVVGIYILSSFVLMLTIGAIVQHFLAKFW